MRARRGDPDVWPPLDEAAELVRGESPQKIVPLQVVRAEAAYLAGDPARAWSETGTLPVADARRPLDRRQAGRAGGGGPELRPKRPAPLPEPCRLELAGDHAGAAAAWDLLGSPYDAAIALARSDDEDELRRSHERLLALGARPAAAIVARAPPRAGRARGRAGPARGDTRAPGRSDARASGRSSSCWRRA